MTATFNHMIIPSKDAQLSARFYVELLEAEMAPSWGVFHNITLPDGVLLQFAAPPIEFVPWHFVFLIDDEHFDRAYALIQSRALEYWADPQRTRAGQINTEHGGRGVYLLDPAGHYLELITRPYL
ncbi:VOC family protein [Glutamicibacter sp. PS]|uniref:VOC family protein n=1 Tax=Glutamicibacter sp. PS TaxID=3075634 RepID=UPI00283B64A3|nr:VOC family protein [Glutamicibacter sp. PS]MDR4532629.1 VOC family protein [Glutamicibacter sp. PS]